MTTVLPIDYDTVIGSEEYQHDFDMILDILNKSIALDPLFGPDEPTMQAVAYLLSIQRYYIRHFPDQVDIDLTSFIQYIQAMVGLNLPNLKNLLSVSELLRESKRYNGHKTVLPLFDFIGDLIGAKIEIRYPSDLIFRLDAVRSCLDGAVSNHGPLAWKDSKLAHIEDGYMWSEFTYIVAILQMQQITNLDDLIALLNNVHPAGLRRIIDGYFNYVAGYDPELDLPLMFKEVFYSGNQMQEGKPTLDNYWLLDNPSVKLDMFYGSIEFSWISIKPDPVSYPPPQSDYFFSIDKDSPESTLQSSKPIWMGPTFYIGGYDLFPIYTVTMGAGDPDWGVVLPDKRYYPFGYLVQFYVDFTGADASTGKFSIYTPNGELIGAYPDIAGQGGEVDGVPIDTFENHFDLRDIGHVRNIYVFMAQDTPEGIDNTVVDYNIGTPY